MAHKLKLARIIFGCDPEFFFEKDGKILGSETIIDNEKGIDKGGSGKIICDGVQVELNPRPHTCRQQLAYDLGILFMEIDKKRIADPTLKVNFNPYTKVTKARLKPLSDKSKIFGCMPSKSIASKESSIVLKPATFQYRSAGGHIHIGKVNNDYLFENPERLINILDIIVGNTMVLIDRDKGSKLRRQMYGKAGEYRTPKHGLEYRTLSNFWLRSYPLMSFVMGMTRFAMSIVDSSIEQKGKEVEQTIYSSFRSIGTTKVTVGAYKPDMDFEKELLSLVNMEDIQNAINNNDYELAYNNFKKIKKFIEKYSTDSFSLHKGNMKQFEYFVEKGINHYFKDDPVTHWVNCTQHLGAGWERFLDETVAEEMAKKS